MILCKRLPFLLILFSLFSFSYFISSAAAAPERHELAPPGTPERNPDGTRDETLYRIGEMRNGYAPGLYKLHIDGMRPPNEEGYSGVGCDSRQDPRIWNGDGRDPADFPTWGSEPGSGMQNGKPYCQNIDLAGYRMKMGDIGWVPPLGSEELCINNYGPTLDTVRPNLYGRFAGESELCAWIRAGKPVDGTKLIEAATRKKEAAEQRLQTAKDTLSVAELKIPEAQTALDKAIAALAQAIKDNEEADQVAKALEEETARLANEIRQGWQEQRLNVGNERANKLKEEGEERQAAIKENADQFEAGNKEYEEQFTTISTKAADAKSKQKAAIAAAAGDAVKEEAAKQAFFDAAVVAQQQPTEQLDLAMEESGQALAELALARIRAQAAMRKNAQTRINYNKIINEWGVKLSSDGTTMQGQSFATGTLAPITSTAKVSTVPTNWRGHPVFQSSDNPEGTVNYYMQPPGEDPGFEVGDVR